ncbi:energy transducer TonB [Roseovarius rhodophyticola]|uniref:Energy transducer TonB n=1 Tax=Roseovarius rhodophyticola TaxID=3080827 RepID=A0ABZ2TBR8_9RHOB|nr:energy transducer TonB [Roseovarius sp. W115]MDV2930904.1 energy transducer TonB [Roseovarius sp. W115]
MNTGQVISGVAHTGLVAFAIFGGAFQAEPLPFRVTEVTAISAEEYAALVAPEASPEAVANVDTPEPPQEGESAPEVNSEADDTPELEAPEVAETPPPDPVPEVTEPEPAPEAEVSDEPPVLDPPDEEVAVLVPEQAEEAQAEDAPRVAPEPVAQPEPDVAIDEVEREEVQPDALAEEVAPDEEATAPEEATTEIVTEADQEAAAAPTRSLRPQTRPDRPEPAAEPEEATEEPAQTETAQTEDEPDTSAAVNDALAEALGTNEGAADTAPQGPPLTAGEKDALRVSVQRCWNVGSLSTDALQTTVVVSVNMSEDARPVSSSIRMLSSSGGSTASAEQAFQAARRAILRCGASGFDLPADKYASWREIEMTFNPERMRIK